MHHNNAFRVIGSVILTFWKGSLDSDMIYNYKPFQFHRDNLEMILETIFRYQYRLVDIPFMSQMSSWML